MEIGDKRDRRSDFTVRTRLRKAQDLLRSVQPHNKSVAVEVLADAAIELIEKAIRVSLNVPHS